MSNDGSDRPGSSAGQQTLMFILLYIFDCVHARQNHSVCMFGLGGCSFFGSFPASNFEISLAISKLRMLPHSLIAAY